MFSETGSRVDDRLTIHRLAEGGDSNAFAGDVRAGLSADSKSLSPKYFYDELGSRLFEAICCLPVLVFSAKRKSRTSCSFISGSQLMRHVKW